MTPASQRKFELLGSLGRALVLVWLFGGAVTGQSVWADPPTGSAAVRGAPVRPSSDQALQRLQSAAAGSRTQIALELSRSRDPHAFTAILAAVEKSTGREREDLVLCLGLLGDENARTYLRSLAGDRAFARAWLKLSPRRVPPTLRASAVLALGFLGSGHGRDAVGDIVRTPERNPAEVHLAACLAIGLRAAQDAQRINPLRTLAKSARKPSKTEERRVATLVSVVRRQEVGDDSRAALLISLARAFPRYAVVQELVWSEVRRQRHPLSRAALDAGSILLAQGPRSAPAALEATLHESFLAGLRRVPGAVHGDLAAFRKLMRRRAQDLQALDGIIVLAREADHGRRLRRLLKTASSGVRRKAGADAK